MTDAASAGALSFIPVSQRLDSGCVVNATQPTYFLLQSSHQTHVDSNNHYGFNYIGMQAKLLSIFHHKLIRAGIWVMTGSFAVNALNYLFNLIIGRMLPVHEFGEVVSLFSLLVIVSVPASTLTFVMTKYVAGYQSREQFQLIGLLQRRLLKWISIAAGVILLTSWLFIPWLQDFLHIDRFPLALFTLMIPLSLFASTSNGTLQGLHDFSGYAMAAVISALLKLAISIGLVQVGQGVSGVLSAVLLGSIAAWLFSLWRANQVVNNRRAASVEKENEHLESIWRYGLIVSATMLMTALLANADVVLAKHYLTEDAAGQYAALSLAGKVISYGSGAFIGVMFPFVAASDQNDPAARRRLFHFSLTVSGIIAVIATTIYAIIPSVIMQILFGSRYVNASGYLIWFAIATLFSTISTGFTNYFLATHRYKQLIPVGFCAVALPSLLLLFHATIAEFALINVVSNAVLVVLLLGSYGWSELRAVNRE